MTEKTDLKDFSLRDKLYAYSLKVEIPSRVRPLNLTDLRDTLYKTEFSECGHNEYSGVIHIEGIYGVKLVDKRVPVTLSVNDKAKRILVVPSKAQKN